MWSYGCNLAGSGAERLVELMELRVAVEVQAAAWRRAGQRSTRYAAWARYKLTWANPGTPRAMWHSTAWWPKLLQRLAQADIERDGGPAP